ncbi:hypothetical protein GT043_17955, partial [Streptomyces sp. SID2131]|nr:hypothetical protein [Streptomyces sp. SID2131]
MIAVLGKGPHELLVLRDPGGLDERAGEPVRGRGAAHVDVAEQGEQDDSGGGGDPGGEGLSAAVGEP